MEKIQNVLAPSLIIIFAVLLRLLPHPPNFTPIAAMALFGGCYLDRRVAILLPLSVMVASDLFLGFHQSMLFVYGSLVLTSVMGIFLKKRKTIRNIILATVISSTLFFLITNFGFWLTDSLYPKTLAGQITAYAMALPFFRNTLIGDLFYTGLLFGGYELFLYIFKRKAVLKS